MYNKVLRLSTTQHRALHGPLCRSPWSFCGCLVCSIVVQGAFHSSLWLSVVLSLVICSTCCGSLWSLLFVSTLPSAAGFHGPFCSCLIHSVPVWLSAIHSVSLHGDWSHPLLSVVPSVVLLHSYLLIEQDSDWLMLPTTANQIIGMKEPNLVKILILSSPPL